MTRLESIYDLIRAGMNNPQVTTTALASVLLVTGLLSTYEYLIYRFVSKRSFYSKQFNIVLAILPFFIATIIMTLQSNLLITLGTIGALAIIRFRTAVKDPIDMVYLLWSLHTGIVCGCGLYEVGILTSLTATAVLLVLEFLPLSKAPFLLAVNARDAQSEGPILVVVARMCRYHKVKSRNLSSGGLSMIIEVRTKQESKLLEALQGIEGVTNLSLVCYDGENFS